MCVRLLIGAAKARFLLSFAEEHICLPFFFLTNIFAILDSYLSPCLIHFRKGFLGLGPGK